MSTTEERDVEQQIQEAGATAPRITPEYIDSQIIGEEYYVFSGTTVTVCCMTLKNGFNVIGHSASASVENFNKTIGERLAREKAREHIWQLEGYLLRDKLSKI